MLNRFFGFGEAVWEKEGDFSVKLPPELKAKCEYFVKFKKGPNQLCIFRRTDRMFGTEFQISYTVLTAEQVEIALSLKAGINPYHSGGSGSKIDGIETIFFNKTDHLKIALDFIDQVNPLNEIKNEVYGYIGLVKAQDNKLIDVQYFNL